VSFRRLDDKVQVAGQIGSEDARTAAAQGVTMIVNNRPDGEEPGQPAGAEIEAAATKAGIAYRHIPVSGGFSEAQVEAMTDALEAAEGPVLAFCKSGTRSTFLWALAKARHGAEPEELASRAAEAGYDLSPIFAYLRR
jgi:uncharacterized protein (TIGR01244 family)